MSRKILKLFFLGLLMLFSYNELSFALADDVLLYDETEYKSSPFEMHSFSFGYGKSYSENDIGNPNKPFKYYEFRLESPIYKEYVALGFEYSFMNKPTIGILGNEYTFSIKFRAPLHTSVGDIALTNSYRAGLFVSFYHERNNVRYSRSLGGMGAIAVGLEYFPIRWFGLFAEQSIRHYAMRLNKEDDFEAGVNIPFSFTNHVTVFGIKVTF